MKKTLLIALAGILLISLTIGLTVIALDNKTKTENIKEIEYTGHIDENGKKVFDLSKLKRQGKQN